MKTKLILTITGIVFLSGSLFATQINLPKRTSADDLLYIQGKLAQNNRELSAESFYWGTGISIATYIEEINATQKQNILINIAINLSQGIINGTGWVKNTQENILSNYMMASKGVESTQVYQGIDNETLLTSLGVIEQQNRTNILVNSYAIGAAIATTGLFMEKEYQSSAYTMGGMIAIFGLAAINFPGTFAAERYTQEFLREVDDLMDEAARNALAKKKILKVIDDERYVRANLAGLSGILGALSLSSSPITGGVTIAKAIWDVYFTTGPIEQLVKGIQLAQNESSKFYFTANGPEVRAGLKTVL